MRKSQLLNLVLAALVAVGAPAWCCCATAAAAETAIGAAAQTGCPRCHETRPPSERDPARPPAPPPGHCPHAAVRSLAAIEQAPRIELPPPCFIGFTYPLEPAPQPAQVLIDAIAPFDPSLPAAASLLALGCMLLI